MQHIVLTSSVKLALIILYIAVFFIFGILKILQLKGKEVENYLIRMRSFLSIKG